MELKDAMLKRRSIRKFTDEKISDEDILEILHSAMSGPSACNRMPWEFYIIRNEEILEKLYNAAKYSKIIAPLAIVVCGNLKKALPFFSEFWIQDCSAATENILLRAVDLGLGAVWCGVYPMKNAQENVSEILNLPKTQIPLNIIYIGHPAGIQPAKDCFDDNKIHFVP